MFKVLKPNKKKNRLRLRHLKKNYTNNIEKSDEKCHWTKHADADRPNRLTDERHTGKKCQTTKITAKL